MRTNRTQCRVLKRCICFFATVTILPFALVYFIVSDQIHRIRNQNAFIGNGNNNNNQSGNAPFLIGESQPSRILLSESEIEIIEARMQQRADLMSQKCAEYGLDLHGNDTMHKPNPWEFLVNRKYHLIWCNVFKAASTSWMYNFNIMAGYSSELLKKTNIVPLELARKRYPRVSIAELEKALNDSIAFLIVRHPFERLVSAYRDKIVFAIPHSYHDKLGNRIVKKFRKITKNQRHNDINVTTTPPKWPTFSEFVAYLLDEEKRRASLDMHWTSITKFCTPCQIHFNIIAKFETLYEDQRFLIQKTNLEHIITPQWRNSGKGQKKTENFVRKFFSQLTRDQLDELYRLYRYDFELFNYSSDAYYEMIDKLPSTKLFEAEKSKP